MPMTFGRGLLATLAYLFVSNLIRQIVLGANIFGFSELVYGIQFVLSAGIILALVYWYVKNKEEEGWKVLQPTSDRHYHLAFLLGAIFGLLFPLVNGLYEAIGSAEGFVNPYDFRGYQNLSVGALSHLLIIPITHELFCREYLQKRLMRQYSASKALWMAAVAFTLIGIPWYAVLGGYYSIPPTTILYGLGGGYLSGMLYYQSGSLGPSVALHISWAVMVTLV